MRVSTVNRCVELLSNSMAVLPTFIVRETDHERMDSHMLGPLLRSRANEAMSAYDLTRLSMTQELLRGNAYVWNRRSAQTGRILERIPLAPDLTTPMVGPDGRLWYWYSDPRSGDLIRLSPADICHYKAFSTDGLEGISVLSRAALTLSTAQAAQRYERATWVNSGRPAGVLVAKTDLGNGLVTVTKEDGSTEQITKKERIRREWEKIHRGPDNAFRTAVLDCDLEYKPIAMTSADAQFVETAELRVVDLCRFFGVSPHLVYAGKQSYESNEQQGIEYVNYTLLGYETQWSQEDSYKLLFPGEQAQALRIKREMKVFLRGNTEAQASWIKSMWSMGGYDINEVRALDDRPPVEGGDARMIPLDHVPLDRLHEFLEKKGEM